MTKMWIGIEWIWLKVTAKQRSVVKGRYRDGENTQQLRNPKLAKIATQPKMLQMPNTIKPCSEHTLNYYLFHK